jgi:hypothetical protein
VFDSTSGGYKCILCLGSLLLNTAKGTCDCPAGRFGGDGTCADCWKAHYCPGGTYTGPGTPAKTPCPASMTTTGRRSTSIRACGEQCTQTYSARNSGAQHSMAQHTTQPEAVCFFECMGSTVSASKHRSTTPPKMRQWWQRASVGSEVVWTCITVIQQCAECVQMPCAHVLPLTALPAALTVVVCRRTDWSITKSTLPAPPTLSMLLATSLSWSALKTPTALE